MVCYLMSYCVCVCLSEQVDEEDEEEPCQDIDIARFVLKEVDDTGITVAAADRFSSRVQSSRETDGETWCCHGDDILLLKKWIDGVRES